MASALLHLGRLNIGAIYNVSICRAYASGSYIKCCIYGQSLGNAPIYRTPMHRDYTLEDPLNSEYIVSL